MVVVVVAAAVVVHKWYLTVSCTDHLWTVGEPGQRIGLQAVRYDTPRGPVKL